MKKTVPGRNLSENDVRLDPFTPRIAFVRSLGMRLNTLGDRPGMKPLEVIDTRADKFLKFDALEELASFHGLYKQPVEQTEDAYPEDIEEALGNVEAQFILRNLARTVHDADPDERLNVEIVDSGRLNIATALTETRAARIEPLELLEKMTVDVVGEHRAFIKQLYDETEWEDRFSRELKAVVSGPLWKYDPEAAPEDNDASIATGDS